MTRDRTAYNRAWVEAHPERAAANHRAWAAANREKVNAGIRVWRAANPEKVTEQSKAWYEANRERKSETNRAWFIANPERTAELHRVWYEANRDGVLEKGRLWRAANPGIVRAAKHRRRAREAGIEVVVVVSEFCGVCRGRLRHGEQFPDDLSTTIGHEPPLSRAKELGVTTVIERPEHWVCNKHKNARLDSELNIQRLRVSP